MKGLLGRQNDIVKTADREISGLNLLEMFLDMEGVEEYQIIQNRIGHVDVLFTASGGDHASSIEEGFREFGLEATVKKVDKIERTSSGKLRAVICNI